MYLDDNEVKRTMGTSYDKGTVKNEIPVKRCIWKGRFTACFTACLKICQHQFGMADSARLGKAFSADKMSDNIPAIMCSVLGLHFAGISLKIHRHLKNDTVSFHVPLQGCCALLPQLNRPQKEWETNI